MNKKELSATLSVKSIERLIKEIERYRKDFILKCELFVRKLTDLGVSTAFSVLASEGVGDSPRGADFDVQFDVGEGLVTGKIILSSQPNVTEDGRVFYPHLAWEFGAGSVYNKGASHPLAGKFGMGPGTFPEQTHVPDPGFWVYRDEAGDAVFSYGTQATMPMYNASIEMIKQIRATATEVF